MTLSRLSNGGVLEAKLNAASRVPVNESGTDEGVFVAFVQPRAHRAAFYRSKRAGRCPRG